MRKSSPKMLFVIRQFIWAKDVPSAIRLARKSPIHDCWVDENFRNNTIPPKERIGFNRK